MATWEDSRGRRWEWTINPLALKQLKKDAPDANIPGLLKLAEVSGDGAKIDIGAWATLTEDVCQLYEIAWSLSRAQATEAGVSELEFAESFVGEAAERAVVAILEAFADFFPAGRKLLLQTLARQAAKAMAAQPEAMRQLQAAMDQIDAKTDAMLASAIGSTELSASVTSSAASSE